MASGNTQRSRRTKPVESDDGLAESEALIQTCNQIGALIIGQKLDRMRQGVELLQKQASQQLLQKHMDVWLPRFIELYGAMEGVLGKVSDISQSNLMGELKAKVKAAGFADMKAFVSRVMLPLVSYHGLLLQMNNQAGVGLPADVRDSVLQRMNNINRVMGGACAAMFMQDSMGLK